MAGWKHSRRDQLILVYDISQPKLNMVSRVTDDETWSGTGTPADEWNQR